MILNHPHIRLLSFIIRIIFGISFLGIVILNYFVFREIPFVFLFVFGILGGVFLGFNTLYFLIRYIDKKSVNRN